MSVEQQLADAHKLLARAAGNLSGQIARRKFSMSLLQQALSDAEHAVEALRLLRQQQAPQDGD